MSRSSLWRIFWNLVVGSAVFWITYVLFIELRISRVFHFIFGSSMPSVISFVGPAIPAGYAVSKIYSNGLFRLALVGLVSPYFLVLPFALLIKAPGVIFIAIPFLNYVILIPIVSMFSALFFRKEFRSKIGL